MQSFGEGVHRNASGALEWAFAEIVLLVEMCPKGAWRRLSSHTRISSGAVAREGRSAARVMGNGRAGEAGRALPCWGTADPPSPASMRLCLLCSQMKTVSVALVLCLNVGVDPPDVVKTTPCARLECWIGKRVSPAPPPPPHGLSRRSPARGSGPGRAGPVSRPRGGPSLSVRAWACHFFWSVP